ncbi:MAG: hypothetical protein ABIK33_00810 [candidate division WOR-3 bacterium]
MKMGCLFSGIFWGIIIIIIGIVIIINVIFGTRIPIIPLIIGLLLIYLGIKVITGITWRKTPHTVVFEEKKIDITSPIDKYATVFGKSVIDLTNIEIKEGTPKVEINVVFGSSIIKIDPTKPIKIKTNAAFANARLPDESMVAFGEAVYLTDILKQTNTQNYLLVNLNVVFGNAEVVLK